VRFLTVPGDPEGWRTVHIATGLELWVHGQTASNIPEGDDHWDNRSMILGWQEIPITVRV